MRKSLMAMVAVVVLLPTVAQAKVLWRGDFETGDLSQWSKSQIVSADRLKVVDSPVAQGAKAIRVEVRQGDNPIGASGNRNELVYLSYEPQGTERYYRWQTMFDPSYPNNSTWQVFTQWHHSGDSGSPPVEFDIYGENIALDVNLNTVWHVPLVRGVWHDFVFHVKWSSNASEGFYESWYDGQLVIPKTHGATQFAGQTQYLKQGLYRNNTITQNGIVFHDGFTIGETFEDVKPTPAAADAGPVAGPDAAAPGPDAAAPGADASAETKDAGVPSPADASTAADAGSAVVPEDASAVPVGPDGAVTGGAPDTGAPAVSADTGAGLPPPVDPEPATGCSSSVGGSFASLGLVLVAALTGLRRRR
ncbi:MAG: heparin lyase I family protein [Myxococcales bacterium]